MASTSEGALARARLTSNPHCQLGPGDGVPPLRAGLLPGPSSDAP